MKRALVRAIVTLVALTIAAFAANRAFSVQNGLRATYFDNIDWHDDGSAATMIDAAPSTKAVQARRPDYEDRPFSVEWRGFIAVPAHATYTFAAVSDDGSWLVIDDTLVVDNGGLHSAREVRARVELDAGLHPIRVRYFQNKADCTFELEWAHGDDVKPISPLLLVPDETPHWRVIAHQISGIALMVLGAVWYLVIAGACVALLAVGARRLFAPVRSSRALAWILALSAVLNVWGIWWSMPNTRGWAPDELVPSDVLLAFGRLFSQGWHDKYPPFHYAVISAAYSPVLMLSWLGLADVNDVAPHVSLVLLGRIVSLVLSAGTLVVIYRCGRELYGSRGAAFAALTAALTVPFAYYSKLANLDVPYLFWFAISLFAYIRILKRHETRDYVLFAVSAALAGCTKDQAWGLYFATPFAILVARWQFLRRTGGSPVRILFDRATLSAIVAGCVTFAIADNLVFNFPGFVAHVRLLLDTPAQFQEFPQTVAGQLRLAGASLIEMRYMFGWPLAIVAAIAVVRGLTTRSTPVSLAWLLVPPLSYYAGFLGLVLFYFDRYLFPLTVVAALFVGFWLDRFLAPGVRGRRVRVAAIAAAFAYSVLYVSSVNYAMVTDSRYMVSEWLHAHAGPGQLVGATGPLEFVAIENGFRSQAVASPEAVAFVQPDFIVLAPEVTAHQGPPYLMREALLDGSAGYRLALRVRSPALPLPGRHPDLGPEPRHGPEYSDLSMINLLIEVFERRPPGADLVGKG